MNVIEITQALWGGGAKFNYGRKMPFAGIASYKLKTEGDVSIKLSYLKDKPLVKHSARKLRELAESNGWKGYNGALPVLYLPQDVLLS